MSRRTKRVPTIRSAAIAANGTVDLPLERGICAFSVAVVDAATFAGVAWTLAYESDPSSVRHFAAAAAPYVEDDLRFGPNVLRLGAGVAARVELIAWKA